MTNLPNHPNDLWQRIHTFRFDEPETQFTFCQKLAKEHRWSKAFSERAVEEYRKFIYLCCVLPGGASPPPIVDEVWHLHLTYTYNYWENFCWQTLHRELHHHPSKGGHEEHQKHTDWYQRTWEGYKETFGTTPPADIWPTPKVAAPQPQKNRLYLLLLLPFAAILILYGQWNPYRLAGPQFLLFYALLLGAALTITSRTQSPDDTPQADKLRHFFKPMPSLQLLAFIRGNTRALQYCLLHLLREGRITIADDRIRITDPAAMAEEGPSRLLQLLYRDFGEASFSYRDADSLYRQHNGDDEQPVFPFEATQAWQSPQWLLYGTVIATGLARLIQGIAHHRPVGFLLVLGAVFTLASKYIINGGKALKRKLAKEELESRQGGDEQLMHCFLQNNDPGLATVAGYELLYPLIIAHTPISISGGGDSGSSCGSSGCGSSCGGGCGGCGGCGS